MLFLSGEPDYIISHAQKHPKKDAFDDTLHNRIMQKQIARLLQQEYMPQTLIDWIAICTLVLFVIFLHIPNIEPWAHLTCGPF